jgi:hypothetical protein
MVIKSAGKGALRVTLQDGREVVLKEGEESNGYLARTSEDDVVVIADEAVTVSKDGRCGLSLACLADQASQMSGSPRSCIGGCSLFDVCC